MESSKGSIIVLGLLCLISLTNANTEPQIESGSVVSVCEDTPVGTIAFTINATDADNDALTYSISGPNTGFFRVNANNGSVSVFRPLDREVTDVMELDVGVSDGVNPTNDNKPIFDEPSYDRSIPENTTVGTILFKVHANDSDTSSGGVVQYSIDEVTPESGASLFSISITTGNVTLNGSLNYTGLSSFYRLKINASDGGGRCHFNETKYFSSIVYSFITVLDIADLDPRFFGVPYVGSVPENSDVGTPVLTVTALDQDTGVNDEIIYSIENSTAEGLFKISSKEGIISVSSLIDREVIGDTVTLTVKATESKTNILGEEASTIATVLINIQDLNDNKPEFLQCGDSGVCVNASHFTGEVDEHSLGSISINMTVRDLDKVKFSNTKLILEGLHKDVFSVQPDSTVSQSIVQLLVKQPDKLDFENIQQMVVTVIAMDQDMNSFQSTATVTINIKDINDNSPTFPQNTYKLNVSEHSPAGTVVANITAVDPDTMDQNNITYSLLPVSILPYFYVEPHAGIVYVTNQTILDREVRSLYSATLQARDSDGKPGSTVLEITVTDINDHPPLMNRDSYLAFVKEGGRLTLKIEATDADESDTVNSQIVFGIEPSEYSANFTIDPSTGVLTNSGELDREALDPELDGKIELNVTATDKGNPQLSSVVSVIINVEDINDNEPQFAASSYKFSVKEGEKGAFVGSVLAEDLDQTTEFNRISFSILDGSFGSFIVRTFAEAGEPGLYRGNITVDPDIELDYESARKNFTLRLEATDLGQKKAEVTVEVEVLDVNDERPEFERIETVSVKENMAVSGAIGSFLGHDKDGNHSLVYKLESMKCRCNGSLSPCSSFILEPNGTVFVDPANTVDYEECDQVVIEAQVVDEFTEKGENDSVTTGVMVINIEDINDNAPEFIYSDSVFVVVSESASKGTSVAGVTASDRDSGVNRQIEFKVTAVQFEDANNHTSNMRTLFEAVTTQQKDIYVGIIQTTEGLDITLKGKYLVTVTATDTGDLSTSTVLEIFTVDESYKVELEFTSSEAEVEKNLNEILRALTAATRTAVEIVAIRPDTASASRASGNTIIVAYFVYSNGTALTSIQVERMLSEPEHYLVLGQLGLKNIGSAPVNEPETDPLKYVLLGMVGGLVIVLAVLTTSLMCTRRNYKRKLKAAKAMNSASMVNSDNQKSGPVVPGTNKYTMEGANPVLNLHIDTTLVLDLDEESSDVDKVSLNSLDCGDDMIMAPKETTNKMMMIQEEDQDSGPPEYIEPLGAALAGRGQKKGSKDLDAGFSNPAFSTTYDL